MIETGIYIGILTAIIGIALPILIQVITRLDEKYNSDSMLRLFLKEKSLFIFKISLLCTIFFAIIWSFKLPQLFPCENPYLNNVVMHSAELLVMIGGIILLVSLLWTFTTVIIYYTPWKLIPHLIKSHGKANKKEDHFNALTDIFLKFLNLDGKDEYTRKISFFISDQFSLIRDENIDREAEYPALYLAVSRSVSDYLNKRNRKDSKIFYNNNIVSEWLLGDMRKSLIHHRTYSNLWYNLQQAIENENIEQFMSHWRSAHQNVGYMTFFYHDKESEDEEAKLKIRTKEKKSFIRFHYTLGGLLIYRQKYGFLNRIFRHTTSQPPKYDMLPETMTQIFEAYALTRGYLPTNDDETFRLFQFPGTDGLRSEGVTIGNISKYIALLFLRQFTLQSFYFYYDPLRTPVAPSDQHELTKLIDGLDFFKLKVEEILNDADLIKTIGYNPSIENSTEFENDPIMYLDKLKLDLISCLEDTKVNAPLSPEKEAKLFKSSSEILSSMILGIKDNLNPQLSSNEFERVLIYGITDKLHKDALIESSMVHHTNYDTFLAQSLAKRIREIIQTSFYSKKTVHFLIEEKNFKSALKNLNLDNNHVIVYFGGDIQYYLLKENTTEKDSAFFDLDIREFSSQNHIEKGAYILLKEDLPQLNILDSDEDFEIDRKPKKIDEDINLYGDIKISDPNLKFEGELAVDISLFIKLELLWKRNAKVVFLRIKKDFDYTSIPNKPNEIKQFQDIFD